MAFSRFDADSKGFFTSDDYKKAILDEGQTFGGKYAKYEDEIEREFPGLDRITYEDFYNYMRKSTN